MSMGNYEGRRRDAFHEAAHAVFSYHAGAFIKWATITNAEGGGLVKDILPDNPSADQYVLLSAGALAGSHSAERSHGQEHNWRTFEQFRLDAENEIVEFADMMGVDPEHLKSISPYDTDDEQAYQFLQSAMDYSQNRWTSPEECYEEVCRQLAQGCDSWWSEIEAVAEGLLKSDSGRLEGDEIVKLIRSAQQGEE